MSADQSAMETLRQLPQYMNMDLTDTVDSPMDATVSGKIPEWLNGSLYSNGSGVYRIGATAWDHLFDGYCVLQRFRLHAGQASYQSSVLDTEEIKKCKQHNKIVGPGFAAKFPDPNQSSVGKFFSRVIPTPPNVSEKTNINVLEFGDKLFAIADTPLIHEITPEALTVKGKTVMSDHVSIHLGTSHPHMQKDGSLIYYGTNMQYTKSYNFISVPPPTESSKTPFSEAKVIAHAPSRFKTSISFSHSFGVTAKFFVQLEQPLTMSLSDLMLMQTRNRNIADCFHDNKGETLDFLLLDKSTGHRVPITYKAPPGVVFHFANSYEDSDHVICDVSYWPAGAGSVKEMYLASFLKHLQEGDFGVGKNYFARFVLPLKIEGAEPGKNLITLPNTTATAVLVEKSNKPIIKLTPETLEESLPIEMPQINKNYDGLKHRYVYATTFYYASLSRLAKFDTVEKRTLTYDVGSDHIPGEPVFVPRPGATEEDDGVVLSMVMACRAGVPSFLVVLDAATFQEVGRASLPAEIKMGLTFHSMYTDKTF